MNGILLDLSEKVDQTIVEAVAALSSVAKQLDFRFSLSEPLHATSCSSMLAE